MGWEDGYSYFVKYLNRVLSRLVYVLKDYFWVRGSKEGNE